MILTTEDIKTLDEFSKELHILINKKTKLDEDILETGFAPELMQRLIELSAEFESLTTRQNKFLQTKGVP